MNVEQFANYFNQPEATELRIRAIVIFGRENSYRLKGMFVAGRWQMITDHADLLSFTQGQIDHLCRLHGWVMGQPERISTMDMLYRFSRPEGQITFNLASKDTTTSRNRGMVRNFEQAMGIEGTAVQTRAILFANMEEAIKYGVGAYVDYDTARVAYMRLREQIKPTTAQDMFAAWVEQCRTALVGERI